MRNDPTYQIYYIRKQISNEFMVSVASFKSWWVSFRVWLPCD